MKLPTYVISNYLMYRTERKFYFIGVCVSLAILAIGFQLADTNTPLVTVIEDEDDACHSYKVSTYMHFFGLMNYFKIVLNCLGVLT